MSGPHALFRTPNRPVFEEKDFPNPDYEEGGDEPETVKIQIPVAHPTKKRRQSFTYQTTDEETGETETKHVSFEVPAQLHVLDYRPQAVVVSKHAKGRTPKLTPDRKRRALGKLARAVQARKTLAVTHNKDREALERALNA